MVTFTFFSRFNELYERTNKKWGSWDPCCSLMPQLVSWMVILYCLRDKMSKLALQLLYEKQMKLLRTIWCHAIVSFDLFVQTFPHTQFYRRWWIKLKFNILSLLLSYLNSSLRADWRIVYTFKSHSISFK